MNNRGKEIAITFFSVLVLGFLLNFFWEIIHGVFLYERQWASEKDYVLLILRASLGDAMYLAIMYILGALIWKDALWVQYFTVRKVLFIILIGVLTAVFIEYKGVYLLGKWSYAETMPIVLGFGVSPLAELAVTGTVVFFVSGLLATIKRM